ncbi:MAG: PQQ-binding-like beta-propeller repeat protein [Planctomycetia bacterium]|nr:PQQ-binding-like beta-propeller repeat protein [Planctomycetia bacterium]
MDWHIDPKKWQALGIDDPAGIPPRLMAILGDSRFLHPDSHLSEAHVTKDRRLMVTRGASSICVWNLSTGDLLFNWKLPPLLRDHSANNYTGELAFNASESMAGMVQFNKFYRFNIRSGEQLPPIELTPQPSTNMAVSMQLPSFVRFSEDLSVCAFVQGRKGTTVGKIEGDSYVPLISDRVDWLPQALINGGRTLIVGRIPEELKAIDLASPPSESGQAARRGSGQQNYRLAPPYLTAEDFRAKKMELFELATGKSRWVGTFETILALAASPDGRLLSVVVRKSDRQTALIVHDLVKDQHLLDGSLAELCGTAEPSNPTDIKVKFSADGSLLVVWGPDFGVRVLDAATGGTFATSEATKYDFLDFSCDESSLAGVDSAGRVQVWNMPAGTVRFRLSGDARLGQPRFSPDGRSIYAVCGEYKVRRYDAKTGKQLEELSVPKSLTHTPYAIGPDGSIVLYGDRLQPNAGNSLHFERGAYSPNGELFFRDRSRQISIIDIASGQNLLDVREARLPCAVSPDRKLLAIKKKVLSQRSPLEVWSLESKQLLQTFPDVRSDTDTFHSLTLAIGNDGVVLARDPLGSEVLRFNSATGQTLSNIPLLSPNVAGDSKRSKRRFATGTFSPKASYLALSLINGTVLVYSLGQDAAP